MVRTIISLIWFIAAVGMFFMYTKPAYDESQLIKSRIASYDAALQKAAELQQLKQTLLARYNTFNPADIERLNKLLPNHVDNVRLILDLDHIASNHQMTVQNVEVSTPESSQSSQTSVGAITASKQKYDSLTLQFSTDGTYQQYRDFITDLEASLRIVDLVSLRVTQGEARRNGEPIYSYDITMRTYWLK